MRLTRTKGRSAPSSLGTRPAQGNAATGYVIYSAVFLLFACCTLAPTAGYDLARVPGNLGDARFNLYLLEHTSKFFTGQDGAFWTAGFFYPHQNVVAYSDNFLGSSPFYGFFRLFVDRESAFQWFALAGFALNFAAMAFVLHRRAFSALAVSLGAATFAFAPVQSLHLDHIQVLYRIPVPLAWHFLDRFLERYDSRSLALALIFLCWQFYMSLYLGYFLLLLLCFYLLAVALERKGALLPLYLGATSQRSRLLQLGFVAAFCLSLFPLYSHYSAEGISRNSIAEVRQQIPHLLSYLSGSHGHLFESLLGGPIGTFSTVPNEHRLFVGLIPWFALIAGTLLSMRAGGGFQLRRVSFMFWGLFLLTISIYGFSLYELLARLAPPLTGIRVVTRVVHILLLPFAYMTAAAIDRLRAHPPAWLSGKRIPAAICAILLAFAWECDTGYESMRKAHMQDRVTAFERALPPDIRRPIVSADGPIIAAFSVNNSIPEYVTQLDAMLAAQDLNVATLNGYSRFRPPGYRTLTDCASLVEMDRDYRRLLPGYAALNVPARVSVVPAGVTCGVAAR